MASGGGVVPIALAAAGAGMDPTVRGLAAAALVCAGSSVESGPGRGPVPVHTPGYAPGRGPGPDFDSGFAAASDENDVDCVAAHAAARQAPGSAAMTEKPGSGDDPAAKLVLFAAAAARAAGGVAPPSPFPLRTSLLQRLLPRPWVNLAASELQNEACSRLTRTVSSPLECEPPL